MAIRGFWLKCKNERIVWPGDRVEALLYVQIKTVIETDDYSLNGGDARIRNNLSILLFRIHKRKLQSLGLVRIFTPDPGHTDIVYFAGSDRWGQWFINGEQFPNITIETIVGTDSSD